MSKLGQWGDEFSEVVTGEDGWITSSLKKLPVTYKTRLGVGLE